MSLPPSMVHKSGDKLVVRSVVSGDKLFGTSETEDEVIGNVDVNSKEGKSNEKQSDSLKYGDEDDRNREHFEELPQCKVKRNYACSSCSYYTQNPRYYLHHLKNVHKEKIRIYECPHCLYASKHSQKLQRHIHMVHVMGKRKMLIKAKTNVTQKNVSPIKEISSPDESSRKKLFSDEESSKLSSEVDGRLEGGFASSIIQNEEQEQINEMDEQSEIPLKCSLCSFSSRNPNLVARHERLVHLKKKFYRCTKCDYITHMKARFTKHVKYHSMPMIKCEMCDFRTPYKWNLDRHNKNHFANGAFKCSQCNFTADIKQSLTVHEMNHHVPPVNQNGSGGFSMPAPAKRRCRVGASDIIGRQEASFVEPDFDDLELLRMERESLTPLSSDTNSNGAVTSDEVAQMAAVEITMVKPNVPGGCKMLNLKNPTAAAYLNGTLKPEDVILTKTGSVYVKKFKCRVCQYKAAWESEMIRHEVRVHGLEAIHKKKSLPRPIPNLIPIQNNNSGSNNSGSSPNSKQKPINSSKNQDSLQRNSIFHGSTPIDSEFEKPLTEKDLNDIYAKSCPTSSLKDFASLISSEETIKSDRLKDFISMFGDIDDKSRKIEKTDTLKTIQKLDISEVGSDDARKVPESFKKKNATFFDRLKEKLMVGAGENGNLACWCGHKSKCLSESVLHQKTHSENLNDKSEKSVTNGPLISGAELSSTRCQHCRQRCKTSSDLFVHLQSCPEMIKKGNDLNHSTSLSQRNETIELETNGDVPLEELGELEDEPDESEKLIENHEIGKEENKVFVWNNFGIDKSGCDEYPADDENRSKSPASESSLVGYEIAPGIGSVIPNNNDDNTENYKFNNMNIDINNSEGSAKKVFKCPTCNFWASTASRFHVHIVSHMNVKPFGCSVCPYQTKWKWDVTKHIRLKKERDPSHEQAEVRTIDMETGRRNYTKYNRFLTIMRVHEPQLDMSTKSSTNVQSPVPILPKLTPAPSVNGDIEKDSVVISSDVSMRPLPQLHPANPAITIKRPHDIADDSEIPRKKIPSEKKMWKCKKCKFRNTDRNVVLAHVKQHYTNGSHNINESTEISSNSDLYKAYGQEFQNRIENHENKVDISMSSADDTNHYNNISADGTFKCEICNFETDNLRSFQFHTRHHEENLSAQYRCCFCPFFSNDKQFMLSHISSHGIKNIEESLPLITNNVSSKIFEDDGANEGNVNNEGHMIRNEKGVNEEMEIFKRFKCGNCPYVTNNKSQYLYHKQFHRLRNAPFKCNICSYNVTKRHLLHQHLKIHGVKRAQFKSCIKDAVEKELPDNGFTLNTDVETAHLPDIPLVWVHKAGALTKMFKCRHCPHVNLRKSNIHEHEKMHFDRIQRSPNGSITSNQTSTHRCTECNYVCNNAGALASHFKVHQGAFGQICALADSRRSDESQIREITRLLKDDERFKKETSITSSMIKENQDDSTKNKKIIAMTVNIPAVNSNKIDSGEVMNNTVDTITMSPDTNRRTNSEDRRILHFCTVCPARFFFQKDLESHSRFHSAHHAYKCNSCTYSAPQQAQLLAHKRVHTNEYQEKTNQMSTLYEISNEFPRPKTTLILDKPGFTGLGWVVVHTSQKKLDEPGVPSKTKVVTKQFSCHKCPAQFFKSVALQHHLTLHGGKDQYECRSCDYRVKTYGNLIKHETVHGLEPRMKAKAAKNKKLNGNGSSTDRDNIGSTIPCSGTELFQHRSEQMKKEQTTPTHPLSSSLSVDPEFGILIHGSPDFVYPTTLKNGKMKEKRYKCHKCPSAFEKREQYKTHVSLHGAKSKFKCEKCDYSVRYYANYKQHTKKHEVNERCLSERRASILSKASEESNNESKYDGTGLSIAATADGSYQNVGMSPEKFYNSVAPSPAKAAKTLHISIADQQAVVLMQEKITDNGVNVADQLYRCYYCPYSHQRKDAVENHERCHFNWKGTYVCEFCNYTVPQPHFLREHQKLHFGFMKGIKPEAYMKCDRLEIWMETEEGKVLIFKDNGVGIKNENRFEPPATINIGETEYKKMYVDVKTGEECTPQKNELKLEEEEEKKKIVENVKPVKKPFDLSVVQMSDASSTPSTSASSSPLPPSKDLLKVDEIYDVKKEPLDVEEVQPEEDVDMVNDEDDEEEECEIPEEYEDESTINEVIETVEMEEDTNEEFESNNLESEVEYSDTETDTAEVEKKCDSGLVHDLIDTVGKSHEFKNNEPTEINSENVTESVKMDNISEVEVEEEVNKSLSDDSDSNDSDSSSSSSCSGTSCSSSDSSDLSSDEDEEKGQKMNEECTKNESKNSVTLNSTKVSFVVNSPQENN